MLGKTESKTRRGQKRMRRLDGITDLTDMSLSKLWEMVKDTKYWSAAWGLKESDTTEATQQQQQQLQYIFCLSFIR